MFSKNYFPYTTAAGPCTVNINTLIEKELKITGLIAGRNALVLQDSTVLGWVKQHSFK